MNASNTFDKSTALLNRNNRIMSKSMRTDLEENVYDNMHESMLSQVLSIKSDINLAKQIAILVTVASVYNHDDIKHGNDDEGKWSNIKGKFLRTSTNKSVRRVGSMLSNNRHLDVTL